MARRVIPEEVRIAAEALLDAGASYHEVGRTLGVSYRTVGRWFPGRGHGAPPPGGYQTTAPHLVEAAQRMLDEGASYSEVARTLGVSRRAVRNWFPGRGWGIEESNEYRNLRRQEIALDHQMKRGGLRAPA